jgi:hypothetical protein
MSVIQTSEIVTPSDPVTIKAIQEACKEISASMTRAEGEKDFQKEAIAELAEKTQIPKKFLNKIARLYHRQNRQEVEAEQDATVELYDKIFPDTTSQ